RAQGVDLMIRDRSRSLPPADSGWKLLPSPEPSIMVQESENQTTLRQSATRLRQLEFSHPNASAPSMGGSTLFTTSTEPFDAVSYLSEGSLFIPAAVGKRPDSRDDLQVELPTSFSTPLSSAPPASLTIPSPLPGKDRELLSVPPIRKWKAPKNWFQKYIWDYDSESWRPCEP
ncbi:hypothetical protein EDB84DRAFT_1506622, partial [Lactarius hengduanensis]